MLLCGDDDDVRLDLHSHVCFSISFNTGCSRASADPRGSATVPRPSHTAGLGAPGERTGAVAKLGERRAWKVGLLGVANNN